MDSPKNKPAAIAAAIRGAIESAGYSENRAAELTGIARTTLRRKLDGLAPLNTDELTKLASLLGFEDYTTLVGHFAAEVAA